MSSSKRQTAALNGAGSGMLSVYGWVIAYLGRYKWHVALFIGCGVVASVIELSIPKFIQFFIDQVLPGRNIPLFAQLLSVLCLCFIMLFIVKAFRNVLQRIFQEKTARDLQLGLLAQLRRLGFSYYEQHPTGETLALFNTEVAAVQQIYRRYFPTIIQGSLTFGIAFVFAAQIHFILTISIVPFFLSYYMIGPYFEKKAALIGREAQQKRTEANKKLYDSFSAILELRAFGAQQWDLRRLLAKFTSFHEVLLAQYLNAYLRGTVRRVTTYFGALFLFVYGVHLVRNGEMSVGEFVAFASYYFLIMGDLTRIVTMTTEQRLLLHQAEKLYRFMHEEPEAAEPARPVVLPAIRGEIRFRDVYFGYPQFPAVIRGFELHIRSGEKVALVGTSGNGKSTLLKLVGRFYDPQQGEILLDGAPLPELSFSQLRGAIGFVFQETYLYGTSVMENIRFGRPEASDEQVMAAAQAAYAHDFIVQMPQGYDTLVGERGIKLSGGQKQRIAIARMFVKNPSIVLLDEATSALDNTSEIEVQKALDALLEGRTTIAVAHRLSTVRDYDRIVVMDGGRNVEEGTYRQLLERKGMFYRLAEGETADANMAGEAG
ncbi:ABC transporter ATP-binding protein [Paenibacillus hemerocallicola]|jgi:ATP-binding cassette subfamily B protein/subfamily B ATP-binding cassette protein MsbA|uniref:ABC transporter ATP-binding protein n=1 Tax=Paenibacillus hemerocallicola TaxID=1172614 RepID=A0A5C4T7T2_9BACL|nr:ABC transporter ATP-binding protein [Paenibacillus hemerocallicola]TNJ64369.1 ABC transporter ATP-binding protein [Paenibacillus hemerocallicola]